MGYTILGITRDGDDEWREFRVYDAEWRVTGEADAAAITGYDEDYADLMGFDPRTGKYQYVSLIPLPPHHARLRLNA